MRNRGAMAQIIKDKSASIAAKLSNTPKEAVSTDQSSIESDKPAPHKTSDPNRHDATARDLSWAREQKYLLRVSAGAEYDPSNHTVLVVNGAKSLLIENDSIKAQIKVYIRNYNGLPLSSSSSSFSSTSASSSSPYFEANSRKDTQYGIAFNFVPKRDIDADEATWGIEHDEPVRDRLPPGFGMATKLVTTFVDPSIDLDGYADKPWVYAPALTSWFAWRIGEKKSLQEWDKDKLPDIDDVSPLGEGGGNSDTSIREKLSIPSTGAARKKHFRSANHRQAFGKFEAGRLYQADFFNAYINFAEFAVCLPGMKINCLKYISDKTHRLRWVFKEARNGKLLFCVIFTLLHGKELEQALDEEERNVRSTPESSPDDVASSSKARKPDQVVNDAQRLEVLSERRAQDMSDEAKVDVGKVEVTDAADKLKELAL